MAPDDDGQGQPDAQSGRYHPSAGFGNPAGDTQRTDERAKRKGRWWRALVPGAIPRRVRGAANWGAGIGFFLGAAGGFLFAGHDASLGTRLGHAVFFGAVCAGIGWLIPLLVMIAMYLAIAVLVLAGVGLALWALFHWLRHRP